MSGPDLHRPGDLLDRSSVAARRPDGFFLGTGALVARDRVLTCHHVVEGLDEVEIAADPSSECLSLASVERRDPERDLALLRLDAPLGGPEYLRLADQERGEQFFIAGWTRERGRQQVDGVVQGASELPPFWQVDSRSSRKIEPGCSGAPVWTKERKRMVGLITHHSDTGEALIIPTQEIRAFYPELFEPTIEPLAEEILRLPNLGPSRFVQIVDPSERDALVGQGIRLDGRHVLTTARVAAAGSGPLDVLEGGKAQLRVRAVPLGPDDPGSGTALCFLDALSPSDRAMTFWFGADEMPPTGCRWRAVVFTQDSGDWSPSVLSGRLSTGQASDECWRAELETPVEYDPEQATRWNGAGVFGQFPGANSWPLIGVLQYDDAASGFEVLPMRSLLDASKLEETVAAEDSSLDCESCLFEIARYLRHPEVFREITELRADWAKAAEEDDGEKALAKRLALQSDPKDLAMELDRLHDELLRGQRFEVADGVLHVLMRALPLAFRSSTTARWPDGSANEMRFDLLFEEIVEIALAAGDGGPALFAHRAGASAGPRPLHQVNQEGEYGPDPDGEHEATEIANDIAQRVILDASTAADRGAIELLSKVAAQSGFDGTLLSLGHVRRLDAARGSTPESRSHQILKVLNQKLQAPTRYGRRLYYTVPAQSAEPRARRVAAALRRLVPDLRFVDHAGEDDQYSKFEAILSALQRIHRRHARLGGRDSEPTREEDPR